jgi:probable F420-dependent oxidoreductase
MQIGASYPTTEVPADPAVVRKFIRAVEQIGFSYVMLYDHVLVCPHEDRDPPLTGPYTNKDSFHDPLVLFAYMVALSETLEFATGVLVLPQRQTALLAQQAAGLARLSEGRFRMGVGIGWNYVEYAALGQNFKTKARRMDEQIGLLRELWTNPVVSFEGQFDRIDRAGLNPLPPRNVPLWLGGYSEPAYERGAKLGDGFIFAAPAQGAVEAWGRVQHHLREVGRNTNGYGRELLALFAKDEAETADYLKIWRDAGGTHGCAPSMGKGLGADIDAHIDYLADVKRMVDAG